MSADLCQSNRLVSGGARLSGSELNFTIATFFLQVSEDLLGRHRVFDAGNDFDGATAFTTGLDVEAKYTLQALCPGHR